MHRIPRLGKFSLVLLLLTTLSAIGDQTVRAGDQDGVAGYKFKVYDSDGDGIDGNEPNNGSMSGSSMTSSDEGLQASNEISFSALVVTARLVRYWLIWLR